MSEYSNLPARYVKGTLRLRARLNLPEGSEVRVTVTTSATPRPRRRITRRAYRYPTRTVSWTALATLSSAAKLGGDALADSEALYDGD
jgi:hypothetical protein